MTEPRNVRYTWVTNERHSPMRCSSTSTLQSSFNARVSTGGSSSSHKFDSLTSSRLLQLFLQAGNWGQVVEFYWQLNEASCITGGQQHTPHILYERHTKRRHRYGTIRLPPLRDMWHCGGKTQGMMALLHSEMCVRQCRTDTGWVCVIPGSCACCCSSFSSRAW